MKKIKKLFKAIFEITKKPSLLNIILANDSIWNRSLRKKYNLINGFPVVDISHFFHDSSETLNCYSFLGGGSMATDVALLKLLAKRFVDCSYFEIGTWRGESVINVAEVAKECRTLNLSKSDILSLNLSSKYADLHGFFSKASKNILHLEGNSLKYDFKKLNKKFDLIFIDGNHTYEFVKNDTEKVFKHLVHDKSIVVWHDYAYHPEMLRPEVILGILDGLPKEFQKNVYHVSNTMCAIFSQEKFETSNFNIPMLPNKTFKIKMTIDPINQV